MSKFFRFLVNVFLIAAILIAAAMLVPPLAGVSTTYVDSASMNTNLPFGSITYSRSVDASTLKEGDEVLKEDSDSTYAYVIKSGNASTGSFKVVSATDQNGSTQKITLSGSVQKVAAVVPYIGYVMVALQSTEGILILILIVILNIILFILSVLWRPRTEEEPAKKENEEPDEPAEPVVPVDDHNGIDTDVIRQAVNENNSEYANPSPDELIAASFDQKAENASSEADEEPAAAAAAVEEASDIPAEEEQTAPEEDKGTETKMDHESAAAETAQESGPAPEDSDLSSEDVRRMVLEDGSANDTATDPSIPGEEEQDTGAKKLSWRERRAQKKARRKNAGHEDSAKESKTAAAVSSADNASEKKSTVTGDTQEFIANLGAALKNDDSAQESGADSSYNNGFAEAAASEPVSADSKAEAANEQQDRTKKVEFRDMPTERPYDPDHFVPVSRLTLDELLEQAENNGDEPEVREDEATGITTVDYSKVI